MGPNLLHTRNQERGGHNRPVVMAGLAAIAVLGAAHEISGCNTGIFNGLDKVAPEYTQAEVDSTIEHISLPNETILTEATGRSHATLSARSRTNIPLLKYVYNPLSHVLGDETLQTESHGSVVGIAEAKAITIHAVPKKVKRQDGVHTQWALAADLNMSKFKTGLVDPTVGRDANGHPKIKENTGVVRRIFGNSRPAYQAGLNDWENLSFKYNCSQTMKSVLSAGVAKYATGVVEANRDILKQIPHQEKSVGILNQLVKNGVVSITYSRDSATEKGSVVSNNIAPSTLSIPAEKPPTKEQAARELNTDPENLDLNLGDANSCKLTARAVHDIIHLQDNPSVKAPGV